MDPLVPLLELEKACLYFGKPDYPELHVPSSGGLFKESLDVRNPERPKLNNNTYVNHSVCEVVLFIKPLRAGI